ncbi:MAG: hypothetical protein UH854_04470 [Clostridia bacterium]|nr:hypothetical protein [Clostridia bacterium]
MEKIFKKYEHNPIYGSKELGTCFDVYVTRENGKYRMDFSWRAKDALAVAFSDDGINWSEPIITLPADKTSGWEDMVNRNCVLKIDGKYKMWYTGQARGYSFIGYAESDDGLTFKKVFDEPIIIPERAWEGESVMNPCVLYENGKYRMWYAAGETYEPNVLAYAESDDGINWVKSKINPIFVADENNLYEQDRVGGCQVVKTDDMGYLMFYIGYENIDKAQICVARSDNGITGWERFDGNPIVTPDAGMWDGDACYKPSFLWNEDTKQWMLWYNGRNEIDEFIGVVFCDKRKLF